MQEQSQVVALGFIGFGEAALAIAKGLRSEGFSRIEAYDAFQDQDPHAAVIRGRALEIKLKLQPSLESLINVSNVIISATSSTVAVAVAQEASRFLNKEKLYVDVNAASPDAMKEVASIVSRTESKFVDVAMMGPLPKYRHKVPMLACGNGAKLFKQYFSPHAMQIKVVGNRPGQASAIKSFRSVYMKGAAALLFETCVAADKYQVVNLVVESLSESFNNSPFEDWVARLINGTAIHAGRRIHEMEAVIETLREIGINPVMSEATKAVLAWIDNMDLKTLFEGELPKDYKLVLSALRDRLS